MSKEQIQFVDTLSDSERKRFRLLAIASTWFGCFGDILVDNSAIMILFFLALESSETLTMFQTSLSGIAFLILLVPASFLVANFGCKPVVRASCLISLVSFVLMSFAPWLGVAGKYWTAFWCFVYAFSRVLWSGSWFPLLTYILKPEERGKFFGMMRFSYYVITGTVFFLLGLFMGEKPPVLFLQIVLFVVGLLAWGRWLCIKQIRLPEQGEAQTSGANMKTAFLTSLRNAPLVMFSVYICFSMAAFGGLTPLVLLYVKEGLHFGDGTTQLLSTVTIVGCAIGYLVFPVILKKFGMRTLQLLAHILFILLPAALFFCGKDVPYLFYILLVLLFLCNFVWAVFYAGASSEMLALARPGNATMATAFSQTYLQFGLAAGRIASSLLLGGGLLAVHWDFHGLSISNYQSIFLIAAGFATFCLTLIFCLPSVVPRHDEDYYNP